MHDVRSFRHCAAEWRRGVTIGPARGWLCACLALFFVACSPPGAPPPASRSGDDNATVPVEAAVSDPTPITMSVASSTKELMESLAIRFTRETGIAVRVNSGASSSLAGQIISGAPVDLFLAASESWSTKVGATNRVAATRRLLTNDLVLIAPRGNPAAVKTPGDLTSSRVRRIALAGEKVPAGLYADQSLRSLGLLDPLVAAGKIVRAQDVRMALSYVARGEADAGIVYSTDIREARDVELVHSFDSSLHDEIVYVLVLFGDDTTRERSAARRLFEYLLSSDSDSEYDRFGYVRLRATKSGSHE